MRSQLINIQDLKVHVKACKRNVCRACNKPTFSVMHIPSLISLMFSVDVKYHVHLLAVHIDATPS